MKTTTHRRRGFSAAEVAMSAFIVGLLMAVALDAAGGAVRSQVASVDSARGMHIASGLMSEILELPFEDPNSTPVFGRETGESATTRAMFDDVDDYHNWSSSAQTKTGAAVANSSGLTTTVQVALADPNNLGDGASTPTSPDIKRITVNVFRGSKVIASQYAVVAK